MYVLHYAPDNASLIVRLMLEELAQPYRTQLVDRARRQQDGPDYRRINPAGLIPALETPDGPIAETGAILLWLSERHGALAPAPGDPARATFLKWLFFTSNSLHADLRLNFYADRHAGSAAAVPDFLGVTRDRILRHLGLLEAVAAEGPDWFRPGQPSVMTCYLPPMLRWLRLYPRGDADWFDLAAFPALATIAAEAERRPSARAAALAEGLGTHIFTRPSAPNPPEGCAL